MNGFPVESVIYKYQQGYYNALTVSNNNNDSTVFIEFMLEVILQALEEYQQDTLVEEGRGEPALDLKSKEVNLCYYYTVP